MAKMKMELSKADKYFLKLASKNSFFEAQSEVNAVISFSATGPYVKIISERAEAE